MAYEKLNVYTFVKGPKGKQGEQGERGDTGKGYSGPASMYNAHMESDASGLSLHQVKCGKTNGVVWMVSETAITIGAFSYVTVNIAASGADVADAIYVTKCHNARFYKLSKNPKITKTLFRLGGEEISLAADGYLTYANNHDDSGDSGASGAPSGFARTAMACSMQFSYFVHE